MIAQKKRGCPWQGGWLVVLLGLLALPGWGAAPPVPSGKLSWAQQWRLNSLQASVMRAANAGKMAEALRLAREFETLRRRWQGARHWETINARYQIDRWVRLSRLSETDQKKMARVLGRETEADQLESRHHYAEAEKILREVLGIYWNVWGEQHPETATGYYNLANNLTLQRKHREANSLYRRALRLRIKLLGEQHPDTATSLRWTPLFGQKTSDPSLQPVRPS